MAAKTEEFHRSFGLHGKISATVTDNGPNCVKTFTTFSVPDIALDANEEHSITDDDDMVLADDVAFTDLYDAIIPNQIDDDDLTQVKYQLPLHQRCAPHTLNLVAIVLMWTSTCCYTPFPEVYIKIHLENTQHCGTIPVGQHLLQTK